MFSGKTTELFHRINSYAGRDERTIYINYIEDNRKTEISDTYVTTHNPGGPAKAFTTICYKVGTLAEIEPNI